MKKKNNFYFAVKDKWYVKDYQSWMVLSSMKGVMGHNVLNNKATFNYVLLFMFQSVMKFLGYNCSKKNPRMLRYSILKQFFNPSVGDAFFDNLYQWS